MSFPLEVIYDFKCAYHVMIDMDKIINIVNIIMPKIMIKGFMHINMLGDCLSNIFAIPNIKRGLF
jgi:hypothetical protein